MSMFTLRRSQKQSGFTLMELLIVIAVLGLLLGMLIPRLAGITDDTVDTVCDTNNKGTRYLTQMYINKYNSWPDGLTNLVDMEATVAQVIETGSDATALEGWGITYTAVKGLPTFQYDDQVEAKTIASEFWSRNVPGLHYLSDGEIVELKDMGISSVYQLQGANRPMEKAAVADITTVMMMGMASSSATAEPLFTFQEDVPVGNPEWIGRIMFAVNDKCDLVKKGILQASALCPGAVLAEEDFDHKEYILVLPRLQATMDRFTTTTALVDAEFEFIASDYDSSSNTNVRVLDFVFEAQEIWNFDMSCPEGHKWPDNDEDAWIVYEDSTSAAAGSAAFTAGSTYGVSGVTY